TDALDAHALADRSASTTPAAEATASPRTATGCTPTPSVAGAPAFAEARPARCYKVEMTHADGPDQGKLLEARVAAVHPPLILLVLGGASVALSAALLLLSGLFPDVVGYRLASVAAI